MTPGRANTLTAVALAGLLVAVAATAPRWAGVLRGVPVQVEGEEIGSEASPQPSEIPAVGSGRRIAVRLYFEQAERGGLWPEEREVAFSTDLARQLSTVVEELARGPSNPALVGTLPAETRVLDVFVHGQGVVYVNLSKEARDGLSGGSLDELTAVYSVVDTIVSNFPATRRVQILVEDRVVESLSGHLDLSRPLPPDMTLVATEPPAPPDDAPPAGEPSPGPSPTSTAGPTGEER